MHATIPYGQAIGNIPKVHILPECFYPKKVLPLRFYSPRDVSFIKGEFLLLPDKFRLFGVCISILEIVLTKGDLSPEGEVSILGDV